MFKSQKGRLFSGDMQLQNKNKKGLKTQILKQEMPKYMQKIYPLTPEKI